MTFFCPTRFCCRSIRFLASLVLVALCLPAARAQTNLFGQALDLNGVDQHVAIPANTLIGSPFTVEAWVKVRSYSSWSRLWESGNGPNNDNILCALSFGGTGQPIFQWYNGGGLAGNLLSPTSLPLNVWTHLAFTFDGTNAAIVINGNVVATAGPFAPPNVLSRSSNFVGRSLYVSDGYADAQIEEFRIWSVARSTNFIQAAMNTALPGEEGDLLLYYPFDETGGTTAVNRAKTTGAALNGTYVNSPTNVPSGRYAPIPPVHTLNYYPMGEAEAGIPGNATSNTLDLAMGNTLVTSTTYSVNRPVYSADVPSDAAAGSKRSLEFFASPSGGYQDNACYVSGHFSSTLTDNFGLECWVKFASLSDTRYLVYNGNSITPNVSENGFGILQDWSSVFVRFGGVVDFGTTPIQANVWTHLALVRDNGIATFYVNGEPAGSTTLAPLAVKSYQFAAKSPGFVVGARCDDPRQGNFAGKIDELRLFTFFPGTFRTDSLRMTRVSIASTERAGGGFRLNWPTNKGPFVVQTSAQLTNLTWTTLTNVFVTNNLASLVDNAGTGGFYRLVHASTAAPPVTCTTLLAPPQFYGYSSINFFFTAIDPSASLTLDAPPLIAGQSSCTNAAFTYRWRCSPTSPSISGWNTPSLFIPGSTFGDGNVTFWLDVTDSAGETRTFTRFIPYLSIGGGGGGPPDA